MRRITKEQYWAFRGMVARGRELREEIAALDRMASGVLRLTPQQADSFYFFEATDSTKDLHEVVDDALNTVGLVYKEDDASE